MEQTTITPALVSSHSQRQDQRLAPKPEGSSPLVIAHRGGRGDFPENTLPAIRGALAGGADIVWLSVQVSRDGVPVLYRPRDLGKLTDGSGRVEQFTVDELAILNAGYHFAGPDGRFPYRQSPALLPTLAAALEAIPARVPVLLDLKSPHIDVLAPAIAAVLDTPNAHGVSGWNRVHFYSTQREGIEAMSAFPQAQCFESRDATRERLMLCRLAEQLPVPPAPGTWAGFELHRNVQFTEEFTLGTGTTYISEAIFWDERSIDCFRAGGGVTLVIFGVDTLEDFTTAWRLGVDAVMTDTPKKMTRIRAEIAAQSSNAAHCIQREPRHSTGPHGDTEPTATAKERAVTKLSLRPATSTEKHLNT